MVSNPSLTPFYAWQNIQVDLVYKCNFMVKGVGYNNLNGFIYPFYF